MTDKSSLSNNRSDKTDRVSQILEAAIEKLNSSGKEGAGGKEVTITDEGIQIKPKGGEEPVE